MKVYIARHGQTDLNKMGLLQGRKGLPLNENGIEQAKLLGKSIQGVKFEAVYSSPNARAMETARIATGMEPITDPRIDVYDLGSADNLPKDEVKMKGAAPDPSIYTGVENPEDYFKRTSHFMDELKQKYGNKDVNIFICAHKCTTGALSANLLGLTYVELFRNFNNLSLPNGKIKVFDSISKSQIEITQ